MMDQTQPESNGILSEQAAADENRARGAEATVATDERDNEKSDGAQPEMHSRDDEERRAQALRSAQSLPSSGADVGSLLKNAAAIDAWLKTGETS